MAYSRKDVDKTKQNAKKFVRYQEGAEIDKVTLVNCEIFERYLESFRIP